MPILTIYTPTYNRGNLLPRLYYSLCRQTSKNFLWMIIDDGSNDNTELLVQSWKNENIIEIEYHFKENGGVHTARNMAYNLVKTELILSVDSDDWVTDKAVETILNCWMQHGGERFAGIFSQVCAPDGKLYSKPFPNIQASSYQDFTYKYKWKGDKATTLRSDIIKLIPDSPVYEGEKLIGEGYKWIQLPDNKPFLILNEITHVVDYQLDGYSKNARHNFFNNPLGFRAHHVMNIIHSKYWKPRIKGHIGYIIYSLYLKDRDFIRDSPNPLETVLLLPFGITAYLIRKEELKHTMGQKKWVLIDGK